MYMYMYIYVYIGLKAYFRVGAKAFKPCTVCAGGHDELVKGREPVLRDSADDHTLWSPCTSIQRRECSPTSAGVVQHSLRAPFPQRN